MVRDHGVRAKIGCTMLVLVPPSPAIERHRW